MGVERGLLKTKSIHAPTSVEDGYRISVMSRHTLNDGITPDPLITEDSFNLWMKVLAPPDLLVGDYYKRGLTWSEFEKRYLNYLNNIQIREEVYKLILLAQKKNNYYSLCRGRSN